MSGIIGHSIYAVLTEQKLRSTHPRIAALLKRQWASYLCGAYLGCDIQTLPEAVCVDTGEEVGYGTVPITKSPLTGGAVKEWELAFEDHKYRPRDSRTVLRSSASRLRMDRCRAKACGSVGPSGRLCRDDDAGRD